MAHAHGHSISKGYFLDQVCTVAACGFLGGLLVSIWKTGLLSNFNLLTDRFILPVLYGGVGLIVLACLRGVSLWWASHQAAGHVHDHHDHDACGHPHDDGHEYGFAPWRYAVLLLPLMLSGLMIYYDVQGLKLSYSVNYLDRNRFPEPKLADGADVPEQDGVWQLGFLEVVDAAMSRDPSIRQVLEGRVGELTGLFFPIDEKQFALTRYIMNCCGSDMVPVRVRIIAPQSLIDRGLEVAKGVRVKGKVVFRNVVDSGRFVPVMILRDINDVYAEDIGNSYIMKRN